ELAPFFPSAVAAATYDHRVWALPWNMNVGLLFYRTDLLAKYGLQPPDTYEALVEQARLIRGRERDPALDGYLWQGKQYEGLVVNVLEALWANGAPLITDDGAVFPEPARAADALRFLRGLITSGVSPTWTTAADEELSRRAFGDGHAIFLRNWPYARDLFESEGSAVRDKVAFTAIPGRARGEPGAGISSVRSGDSTRSRRSPAGHAAAGPDRPRARRAHRVPGRLGALALAAAPHPDLRRGALRRPRQLHVPLGRRALLERRPHDGRLHRRVGRARGGAGRRGGAGDPHPAARPGRGALVPAAGVGDARGRRGEALRVALSPGGRPHQRGARAARAELARRSRARAGGGDAGRRLAHDAVRRDPLLRAAAGDPRRSLRSGAGGRRRPARHADADHAAAARPDPPAGGAV